MEDENITNGDFNDVDSTTTATNASNVTSSGPAYPPLVAGVIVLACAIVIVGTIVGNVLVCTAVCIVRKLRQSPSNWLIVSLAVADLLVALLVMPLATTYEVMGRWVLDQTVCDMWTSLDVLLCTASILNLCMISVDRYFVITKPFQYGMKRTPARMAAMIAAVWLLSALISIPPLFGWKAKPVEGECELSQDIGYQFYATIGAFYLPLTVMIVIYSRIYVVSSRIASAEAKSKPVERGNSIVTGSCKMKNSAYGNGDVAGNGGGGGGGDRMGRNGSSSCGLMVEGGCGGGRNGGGGDDMGMVGDVDRLGVVQYGRSGAGRSSSRQNSDDASSSHSKVPLTKRKKSLSFLHRGSFNRMSSHAFKSERKATKTLGVIMGAFTVCWLPFFVLALIKPFLSEYAPHVVIPHSLASILQWLGFANSFFNPIIYARFNREFRTPFKEILLGRCRGINVRVRSESYTEQFGAGGGSLSLGGGVGDAGGSGLRRSSSRRRSSGGGGVGGGVGAYGRSAVDQDGFLKAPSNTCRAGTPVGSDAEASDVTAYNRRPENGIVGHVMETNGETQVRERGDTNL